MRIISDQKDYYDCFMSMDQDRETLYIRKQVSKPVKRDSPEARMMPEWPYCPGSHDYTSREDIGNGISSIHHSMVGFCKKIYPVVTFWHRSVPGIREQKYNICFNLEQVDEFVKTIFDEKEMETWKSKNGWAWNRWVRRGSWVRFFDECKAIEEKHEDIFEKLKAPIFQYAYRDNRWTLIVNPQLKSLEFYRLFPGYQAYQELVMYLGNLASPEKPIPAIDDLTLAEIKGFDKFSFRKDKSK